MKKNTLHANVETKIAHSREVENVAREILIHATILATVCTLIVMVIP